MNDYLKTALLVSALGISAILSLGCKKKEYWPKKSEKLVTPLNKRIDLQFSQQFFYSSVEKLKTQSGTKDELWIHQRILEKKEGHFYDQIEKRTLDFNTIIYKSPALVHIHDFLLPTNISSSYFLVLDDIGLKKISTTRQLESIDFATDTCPLIKPNMIQIQNMVYVNFISCQKNYLYAIELGNELDSSPMVIANEWNVANLAQEFENDFSQIFYDPLYPNELIIAFNEYTDQKINFTIFNLTQEYGTPRVKEYVIDNKTHFNPLKFAYKNKQLFITGTKLQDLELINIDLNLLKIRFQQEYQLSALDDYPRDITIFNNGTIGIVGSMNNDGKGSSDGFYINIDNTGKIINQKGFGNNQFDVFKTIATLNDNIIYLGGLMNSYQSIVEYLVLQ